MRSPIAKLHGQFVEVRTLEEIAYRGKLVEATEESLMLKTEERWIEIPMDKIVSIEKYEPPSR